MDDVFMRYVLLRRRDKYGKLRRRSEFPPGVEVDEEGMRVVRRPESYETMFRQTIERRHRFDPARGKAAAEAAWERFLRHNPKFRTGGYEFDEGR